MLAHVLEFEPTPHEALREAQRVLVPEGHVVIAGFNPWSLMGIWRAVLHRSGVTPWSGDFLGLSRLEDWLALLSFDVTQVESLFFRPPFKSGAHHGAPERGRANWRSLCRLGGRGGVRFGGSQASLDADTDQTTMVYSTPPGERWHCGAKRQGGEVADPSGQGSCLWRIEASLNEVSHPMPDEVEIFTDGACRGNPGPGGWGVLLRFGDRERVLSGAENDTTNNRMELMAAIQGLEALNRPCRVRLVTDSRYVQAGITEWLPAWKRRSWKTVKRQPVKNADLWQRLDESAAPHVVNWVWVRGHSGHPENERVDALARQALGRLNSL